MNSWFTFLKPAGSGIRALRAFSSVGGGPTLFRQASNPNWFVVNKRYEIASSIVATFATDAFDKRPKRQNNTNKTPNAPKTIAQKKNKPKDLFDKSRQTNTIRAKRREDRRSGFPKSAPQTITRFPPPSTPPTTSPSSQLVAPKPAVTVDAYSVGQPLRTDSQSDQPSESEPNTPLTADVMKKFIAGELSVEEIASLPEGPLHRLMGSEGYAEWKNTFIPYNISTQQIEFAAKVFTRQAVHVKDVRSMENLPPTIWPEVAFAGRSNVGKSSLLNAIFSNRSLAFVSNTPGRTQALQFYSLPIRGLKHGIVYHSQETHKMFRDGTIQKGQDELHIVDMPGYGFTKAPPSVSQHWQQLVGEYVASRLTLKRIFILIDARHGLKQIDKDFMNFLDTVGKPYQVVLTKSDKLSATAIQEMIEVTQKDVRNRAACHPFIISTSSKNKEGIDVLRASICTSSGIYRDYLYTNSEATSSPDASSLDDLNRFEESLTEKGVMDLSHTVLGSTAAVPKKR